MDSSQRALQTNGKLFSNVKFVFESLAENQKNIRMNTRREYRSNYNVLLWGMHIAIDS